MSNVPVVVELGPSLTVRGVAGAHEQLLDAFQNGERVEVSVSADAEMDVLFLQLLESARRYAADGGKQLVLKTPDHPGLSALRKRAGFADLAADGQAFWSGREQNQ